MTAFCDFLSAQQVDVWDGSREVWTQGSGTEADPFLIENSKNFAFLFYIVNCNFPTENIYFKLTTNLDLNGSESFPWQPNAGLVSTFNCWPTFYFPFQGVFDGDNHSISNLYIHDTVNLFAALFPYTQNCTIKNLKINANSEIIGKNCAGFIGNGSNSTIYRCINQANITASDNAGRIICRSTGTAGIIEESFNTGNIISDNGITGGIASQAASNSILNCYNTGNIHGNSETSSPMCNCQVGGVVGVLSSSDLKNCYNVGNISSLTDCQGGLVGTPLYDSHVINSYFLNTCGGNDDWGVPKTSDEMRNPSFVDVLNNETDVWGVDTIPNLNEGYPILKYVNVLMSIEESENLTSLVYPNPASNTFSVCGANITGIEVYNTTGSIVFTKAVHSSTDAVVNVSQWIPGIYLVKIINESGKYKTRKVVVY